MREKVHIDLSKLHETSRQHVFARPHDTRRARSTRCREAQMRLSRLVKIWWVQKRGGRRERLAWVGAGRRAQHWRPPRHSSSMHFLDPRARRQDVLDPIRRSLLGHGRQVGRRPLERRRQLDLGREERRALTTL